MNKPLFIIIGGHRIKLSNIKDYGIFTDHKSAVSEVEVKTPKTTLARRFDKTVGFLTKVQYFAANLNENEKKNYNRN